MGGEKPLQMFTKCLHTASNLLCTSKHWGCCKIKSYLQQHLSFFRRAIRGVPNITFFGSSEVGSCRKCDFCVRQTNLLGQPAFRTRFPLVFEQFNYTRKQQTGQPFLSCPVLFWGLMQQPHAVPFFDSWRVWRNYSVFRGENRRLSLL